MIMSRVVRSDPTALRARVSSHDLKLEVSAGRTLRIDAEGRWCSYRDGSTLYQRTMEGYVVRHQEGRIERLSASAGLEVHAAVVREVQDLNQCLSAGADLLAGSRSPVTSELELRYLRTAAEWTVARYDGEAARFVRAYPERMEVLPPDRYRDVVVLPATGCPYGRCTFCAFYRDTTFRLLDPLEFSSHLAAVVALFGGALRGRDGVFLGSASALSLPQSRLIDILDQIRATLGPRRRGVASFLDPDHAPRRTGADFATLRDAGLSQVIIGLETGHAPLRSTLGKKRSLEALLGTVMRLKDAGLRCGLTVLAVPGDIVLRRQHQAETAHVLAALPLEACDLVYVSPLEDPAAGIAPAEGDAELIEALRASTPARVTHYGMDRFHYYA